MEIVIPVLETLILAVPVFALALVRLPQDERRFLTRLAVAAFVLRLFLAILFAMFPALRLYHDDASSYEYFGSGLAAYWHREGPPVDIFDPHTGYANNGFPLGWLYFCAGLYYVFGRYRMLPSGITTIIGTLSVIIAYRLARKLFHPIVARRTAQLTAFFPSMVLWSAMALKDPSMVLLILCALYALVRLRDGFDFGAIVLFGAATVGIWFVRYYINYFVAFATVASLVVARRRSFMSTFARQVVGVAMVVGLFSLIGVAGHLAAGFEQLNLNYLSGYRAGMAISANSGFMDKVDVSTPGGALAFLPIGLAVLLFGPFPWQMRSIGAVLTLPEMIIWWAMIPSGIRGLRFAIGQMFGTTAPVMIFVVVGSCAYALGMGNVGAAFRMRAQVLPLLFVFCALGRYLALCRAKHLDPRFLRADYVPPLQTARG